MCQAKTSYIETEIEWGARFEPCMTLEKGSFRVDLRRFHTTYKVPLPNCSASQAHQLMALTHCKLQNHETHPNWETWAEGITEEDNDKQPSHGGFTFDNIQEERASDGNESEESTEKNTPWGISHFLKEYLLWTVYEYEKQTDETNMTCILSLLWNALQKVLIIFFRFPKSHKSRFYGTCSCIIERSQVSHE